MDHLPQSTRQSDNPACIINDRGKFIFSNNVVNNKFQSVLALAKTEYHNTIVQDNEHQEHKEELKRLEWKEITEKDLLDRQESDLQSEIKAVEEYAKIQLKEIKIEKENLREKNAELKAMRKTEFEAVKLNRILWACFKDELDDFKKTFVSKSHVAKE